MSPLSPKRTILLCLSALLSAASAAVILGQDAGSFTLAKIEVIGLARYAPADVIAVAGLRTGQTIVPAGLDGVARRLAETGLFTSVKYRYVTAGSQLSLTLELAEEAWTIQVVFDNFVWFSDDELTSIVRRTVPSFDRTAPANAGITTFIAQQLQRALDSRGIAGRVEFTPFVDLRSNVKQHVFAVKDAGTALRICALRFDGASPAFADELQRAAALTGTEYSRVFTDGLTNGTLRQIYRRRGYWKAEFAPPLAAAASAGGCGGVVVTLSVTEGVAYAWDRADWSGASAMATTDLDQALGMKTGEVADVFKIDAGLQRMHAAREGLPAAVGDDHAPAATLPGAPHSPFSSPRGHNSTWARSNSRAHGD
jgi:outer membrane protein assembly factor BamA